MDRAVFINYRGEDSHSYGALLYSELARRFGEDRVFFDVESTPAWSDGGQALLERVRSARVLLTVIGSRWLTATDPTGRRRIDDPNDWIRRQLAEAFAAGVRVIPVLADQAEHPREADLPTDIAALSRCQPRRLSYRDPTAHIARIVRDLTSINSTLATAARGPVVRTEHVFINYRGEDSHAYSALLYSELARRFGEDRVFFDVESIPAGVDFVDELLAPVRSAVVLLTVIGSRWLTATDPTGRRRIDDPNDWIRRQLAEAFAAGVRVIPVLTDQAEHPREADLPTDIAALSRCQCRRLSYRNATADVARIVSDLTNLYPTLAAVGAGHVFISYVRKNSELVDRLADALRAFGIEVWLDREQIMPGSLWKDTVRDAIKNGGFFIACFSVEYYQRVKTFMNEELTLAIEELRLRPTDQSWFIPVLLNDCRLPERNIGAGETLSSIQHVALYEDWDSGVQRICSVIKTHRGGTSHP